MSKITFDGRWMNEKCEYFLISEFLLVSHVHISIRVTRQEIEGANISGPYNRFEVKHVQIFKVCCFVMDTAPCSYTILIMDNRGFLKTAPAFFAE